MSNQPGDFPWPNSDDSPQAVRTIHDGMLSFFDTIEDEAEVVFEGLLPAHLRAGLKKDDKPVDVKVEARPGAEKGRVVRMNVPGSGEVQGSTRLLTADPKRRAFSFYNFDQAPGAGNIFFGYSESEALVGNGFPIAPGGAVTREYTGEVWASTDSATRVLLRTVTEADA